MDIPVIEENEGGYYEVFQDHKGHIIKKIWHKEEKNLKKVGDIINQELDIIENKSMNLQDLFTEEKKNKKSLFVQLGDGESFVGEFVSVEKTTGQFGEVNSFTFLIDGEKKILNSKSFGLLKGLASVAKEGDTVKITKTGEGFKTKFQVNLVK